MWSYCPIGFRFCELLLDCSGCEEHSEVILESVVPLLGKPCLNQEQLASLPGETAAVQLCAWVHGVARSVREWCQWEGLSLSTVSLCRLHTTLQSKLRPLQLRMFSMKASLREYTEKLKNQEVKLQVLHDRLAGLSRSLEAASVEKSRQNELVNNMARELRETQGFLEVRSCLFMQARQVIIQFLCRFLLEFQSSGNESWPSAKHWWQIL